MNAKRKTGYYYLDLVEDDRMCYIYFRSGPLVGSYLAMKASMMIAMIFSMKDNPTWQDDLWKYGVVDALAGPMEF